MSANEIYGCGRGYKDVIKEQEYNLLHQKKELLAKEMFKELGYECDFHISYIKYYNKKEDKYIWFYQEYETIEIKFDFDLKILQAINKQVEELGWSDE